jgi:methionyl aminopeptidase
VSPRLFVPEHISKPDYYYSSIPTEEMNTPYQKTILVNTYEDIQKMRELSILGRKAIDLANSVIKEGVTTDAVDKAVH